MDSDSCDDALILSSWLKNARPWTRAVRERQIESRRLCTDKAILEAIASCAPESVIDMGCGEGWLARVLADQGIHVIGVDATPDLIAAARSAAEGDFRLLTYQDIMAGGLEERADVVVCNFSLLGKEVVDGLIRTVPSLLNPGGSLVVQTLHPATVCGDLPYKDGWRQGSWDGFDPAFTDPAPWYFRTLEGWKRLFKDSGLGLTQVRESKHPLSGALVSVVFISRVAN